MILGSIPGRDSRLPHIPHRLCAPSSVLLTGTQGVFFSRGQSSQEVNSDQLPPSSVKVEKKWSYTSTPLGPHGVHSDNSTLLML